MIYPPWQTLPSCLELRILLCLFFIYDDSCLFLNGNAIVINLHRKPIFSSSYCSLHMGKAVWKHILIRPSVETPWQAQLGTAFILTALQLNLMSTYHNSFMWKAIILLWFSLLSPNIHRGFCWWEITGEFSPSQISHPLLFLTLKGSGKCSVSYY